MHLLQKELLPLLAADSPTVGQLKQDCNTLIAQYNQLDTPFTETGQQLVTQINALITKLHQLKDLHYDSRR